MDILRVAASYIKVFVSPMFARPTKTLSLFSLLHAEDYPILRTQKDVLDVLLRTTSSACGRTHWIDFRYVVVIKCFLS